MKLIVRETKRVVLVSFRIVILDQLSNAPFQRSRVWPALESIFISSPASDHRLASAGQINSGHLGQLAN